MHTSKKKLLPQMPVVIIIIVFWVLFASRFSEPALASHWQWGVGGALALAPH